MPVADHSLKHGTTLTGDIEVGRFVFFYGSAVLQALLKNTADDSIFDTGPMSDHRRQRRRAVVPQLA